MFSWLQGIGKDAARRFYLALCGTDYQSLAQFSHDFGVCMRTVADVEKALELCIRPLRRTPLGRHWSSAVDTVRRGGTLTEALKPAQEILPDFYLPLVSAGERSGRLAEVFQFLEEHCKSLNGPIATLRSAWLFPLAILIAGSFIRVFVYLMGGSVLQAMGIALAELLDWALVALLAGISMFTPARYFIDQMRLSLPLLGALEKEIAMHRFFRVMSLVYAVGEHRVETMIRMAADTVSNRAARLELMKAAAAIEEQATITEAFRKVDLLTNQSQATIETAEISGTLEKGFEQISEDAGRAMIAKLNYVQPILIRIVIVLVIFSILMALLSIAR